MIHADDTWALWAILVGWAAACIFLEQRFGWAAKITGCVLALIGTMGLSNLGVIPTVSPVYDTVWNYIVPLAIPLLLFQCNIKKIGKESGRLILIFLLSSVGTAVGVVVGFLLLHQQVPELARVGALFAGTYVGGSVNFVAMADSFQVPAALVSAAVVADNLLMALYFFVLIAIPSIGFFRKQYAHPLIDQIEAEGEGSVHRADAYWKPAEIALKDIAFDLAAAVIIVAVSTAATDWVGRVLPADHFFYQIFTNKYLGMTTITICLATFLPNLFGKAPGANEIGTFFIYIFFAVIGAPASLTKILAESPLLLLYALIIVFFNLIVSLSLGKLFHFSLEEIMIASNANIGGPTTAAAMAISKGWHALVGPIMLIGTLGYVLGNYYGLLLGTFLVNL